MDITDRLLKRFTWNGLTIKNWTSADGTEGILATGFRQGRKVQDFIPEDDIEAYLQELRSYGGRSLKKYNYEEE